MFLLKQLSFIGQFQLHTSLVEFGENKTDDCVVQRISQGEQRGFVQRYSDDGRIGLWNI